MERGQHTFGPMGWEAEQLQPTQPRPISRASAPRRKPRSAAGRCIPPILINLDSSKSSYSVCRFDNQPYWRTVRPCKAGWAASAWTAWKRVVVREAELAGELEEPPDDVQHHWGWIKAPHVDPTKEAMAERAYIQNGTIPWSEAVLSHGKDPDHVLEVRQRDAEQLSAAKLPAIPGIPDPSKAAGAGRREVRGRRSEARGQRSEVRSQKIPPGPRSCWAWRPSSKPG